tara:strand:+ start:8469 stop:8948 length:480 start_codon:yes stop_codon:yes gene_type:complete
MEIKILSPNDCSEKELNTFFQLAKEAKQVDEINLLRGIKNAKLLAFGNIDEELVSISSIKIPNANYKFKIFKSSYIETEANLYSFELGYSITKEKHRGCGYNFKLNRELLSKLTNCKIYATTGDLGMIHLLKKIGFEPIGEMYKGKYNSELQIYSLKIV